MAAREDPSGSPERETGPDPAAFGGKPGCLPVSPPPPGCGGCAGGDGEAREFEPEPAWYAGLDLTKATRVDVRPILAAGGNRSQR